jgi:hypothetical protein
MMGRNDRTEEENDGIRRGEYWEEDGSEEENGR